MPKLVEAMGHKHDEAKRHDVETGASYKNWRMMNDLCANHVHARGHMLDCDNMEPVPMPPLPTGCCS